MLRGSKRITITTEALNRYKFWVLTAGIDLAQFLKNPVLLFMHNPVTRENLPLGRIVELRVEDDGSITGVPEFDDEDDFAVKIYKKYEKGIIKMASAGLIPVEWSDAPEILKDGQQLPTLVRSILDEVSLCDRGANNEALTLCDGKGNRIELSLTGENPSIPPLKTKSENTMKKIELTAESATALLNSLKLSADSDDTAIVAAVNAVVAENVQLTVDKTKLADKVKELESEASELKKKTREDRIKLMVQKAEDDRKITADENAKYVKLALQSDESEQSVKELLDSKTAAPTVKDAINLGAAYAGQSGDAKLSWDELDKSGKLVTLKADNLPLFKQKHKEKFGVEYKD